MYHNREGKSKTVKPAPKKSEETKKEVSSSEKSIAKPSDKKSKK